MENRKLLIVGIDPGTTTGYAVLDIEGNLLHLSSSKQLDLDLLISETINFGRVVLVGTDKVKVPNLVKAFATKLGAKIVSPQEDLKVNEKRSVTNNFKLGDEHQSDALASALFAYKRIKPLLDKIDFFVKKSKKLNIKDTIKELVIIKRISIKSAVSLIEKRDEKSKIVEKVVSDKKLDEKDFLRLYNNLKKYESEIRILKNYNNNLRNMIASMEENKIKKAEVKSDIKKLADFRENRIKFLENLAKSKDNEIVKLKYLIRKFNNIISNINSHYILKKLDNLGKYEFNFKNKILNIQKNDILIVDNPNIGSSDIIDLLKNNVFMIIHKKPISKNIENRLPFIFISAKNLKIEEDKYFGFVEKKHLDMEKDKVNWAKKIIEDYKKEKQQLIY